MFKWIALSIASVSLLCACVGFPPGHLYPVQGPLAAQTPPPIFAASLSGFASGSMQATLATGQVTGTWATVATTDPAAGKLAAQWDAVYGQGFFVANVLGNTRFCRATLSGEQGLHLDADFIVFPAPNPGQTVGAKGVAVDAQGNIYKMTF
jgi:hypothetical protein